MLDKDIKATPNLLITHNNVKANKPWLRLANEIPSVFVGLVKWITLVSNTNLNESNLVSNWFS